MGCDALKEAIDRYIRKADDDFEDILEEAGFMDPEETVEEISEVEDVVATKLKASTKAILALLAGASTLAAFAKKDWPKFKKADTLGEELAAVFHEELGQVLPVLAAKYLAALDSGLVLGPLTQRSLAWVDAWSRQLGEIMQLNTHAEIDRLLKAGLKSGQSVVDFTQAIMDSGIRDEYYRARATAVTELLRAHSYAQHEAFVQCPAVEEHIWRHTGNHKNDPRANHVDMDGQQVPKDQPFTLHGADGGTYYPMCPRDTVLPASESVHCHCIEQAVVSAKVLGMSLEERRALQEAAIAADDGAWEKELDAENKAKSQNKG